MTDDDSLSTDSHSVTLLLEQLREEDPQAAQQIWQRYFARLLPLARAKLNSLPNRVVDEEDILVSVFDRFFRAANEGRFARLHDRDDLWQVLLMLTERMVADHYRRARAKKRGGALVAVPIDATPGEPGRIRELVDRQPSPEFIAAFNDQLARAILRLQEAKAREVALLRLEGHSNAEIAQQLGISLTSVERKLRVVREVWHDEFGGDR